MPNSDLINKGYKIPDKVRNRITQQLSRINVDDKQAKGLQRAKNIADGSRLSYTEMKRLKNYFDNYKGDKKDDEYNLIGGDMTSKWVNDSLGHDRDTIKQDKTIKMRGGMENQFLKTHEKDNENTNLGKSNGGMIDITKSAKMRNIMANDAVYQENYNKEIQAIKYLIEYLNK